MSCWPCPDQNTWLGWLLFICFLLGSITVGRPTSLVTIQITSKNVHAHLLVQLLSHTNYGGIFDGQAGPLNTSKPFAIGSNM